MKEELPTYPQWMYHPELPQGRIFELSGDERKRAEEVAAMQREGWHTTPKACREAMEGAAPQDEKPKEVKESAPKQRGRK